MYNWPPFDSNGDLPVDIYQASLSEILNKFGTGNPQRQAIARRLERIYLLAQSTGQVARFIVFGSFITAKPEPNDVDIFMLMEDSFEWDLVKGEAAVIFDHAAAQSVEGASVFWIRRMAALNGEQAALEDWQHTRENTRRGIIEVVRHD
jgi:hypothetical protein